MRIAICDDEPAMLAVLEKLIDLWGVRREQRCQITRFGGGEALLFETAGSYPFDLMILDIEMNGIGGVDLARTIRETDEKVPLAFLTNHPGYVFEGYEVTALRYLLKPVTEENLFPLLDLAAEKLSKEPAYLVLTVDGEQRRVDQECIRYLEAQGRAVLVSTRSGDLEVKTSFSALTKSLGEDFVSARRGVLVNLRYVEQVGRTECLLEGGGSVPVSRGAWAGLNQAFIDYYKEP